MGRVRLLHNSALLNRVIENDRYPLSPRIRVLRAIRAKLPGAPSERPPTAEERSPGERRGRDDRGKGPPPLVVKI